MRKCIFTMALLALLGAAVPSEGARRDPHQHRNYSRDYGEAHVTVYRAADFGNTAGLEVWSNGLRVSGVVWGHRVDVDVPAGRHLLAATFVPGRAFCVPAPIDVELHGGDPSRLSPAEVADSYQDAHGTLYLTVSWRSP